MSGVIQPIAWGESADALYARYRAAEPIAARKRLQALWLVRSGQSARAAAHQTGVGERTVVRWLGWYRQGGLGAVLARVPGHAATGTPCWLTAEQQRAVVAEAARGRFRTYAEAQAWVHEQYGVPYSYQGLYAVLVRLGVRPKVPRPRAEQADPRAQAAWKRGGSRPPWQVWA